MGKQVSPRSLNRPDQKINAEQCFDDPWIKHFQLSSTSLHILPKSWE